MAGRKKAEEKEKPREHVIELSPSDRATCRTCEQLIAEGELRLAEAYVSDEGRWARSHSYARTPRPGGYDSGEDRSRHYNDSINPQLWQRFHHLVCAARRQPYKLRSALAATKLDIPDRAELEAAIARSLAGSDVAQENAATRDEYERFVAQLDGPDSDEVVLVFADWLESVGDPRGELINVQHALESAQGDERDRLVETERKILSTHKKKLLVEGFEAVLTWRRGFVHRVVLSDRAIGSTALPRVFGHPSFRLLRELAVEQQSTSPIHLPKPLPSSLRSIELTSGPLGSGTVGPVDALIADQLPRLEHLVLRGTAPIGTLRHPSLRSLELCCPDASESIWANSPSFAERMATLAATNLPALRRLALRVPRNLGAAVVALVPNEALLGQLEELVFHGDLSSSAIELLARAGRRFRVIDVRGCRLDRDDLERLRTIADSVVVQEAAPAEAAPKPVGDWLVRHTRKPEWGIGRVVEERDDGLEVEFENGGLKHVRNVELLEDV